MSDKENESISQGGGEDANYNDYDDYNDLESNTNNTNNNNNNNSMSINNDIKHESEEDEIHQFNSYDNYAFDDSELSSKDNKHTDEENLSRKVFLPKSKSEDTKHHQSYDSYLTTSGPTRPAWKRDNEAKRCHICGTEFGLITRKHHCRACGEICCGSCTPGRISLKQLGYVGPQRVCVKCEKEYKKSDPNPRRASLALEPLLQSSLILTDKMGRHINIFHFFLTENSLYWCKPGAPLSTARHHVNLADVLSVSKPTETELILHSFPWFGPKNEVRMSRYVRLKCKNEEERNVWVHRVQSLLSPSPFTPENKRRLLVLINPFSGKKIAPTIWKEVEPIFKLVPVQLTIQKTQKVGHAIEIVRDMNLDDYDGIISVSGDGLVYEIINGLMNRPDWERAIKIPVGTIPAGSGNALAATLNFNNALTATFSICKGNTRAFDILKVVQPNVSPIYSFLSINWGMISDVDFESEKYRNLGAARFTVGALVRITNLRYYRGRVAYLPAKENFRTFCDTSTSGKGECRYCLPSSITYDEEERKKLIAPYDTNYEENEDWVVLDSEFVTVVACNISKLGFDFHAAPFAHISDGYIDLLIVEKCSRTDLLAIFAEMDTGAFVNHSAFNQAPFVRYVKVKAFTLETKSENGAFGFDGERAQTYSTLHVSNLRGIANIMV